MNSFKTCLYSPQPLRAASSKLQLQLQPHPQPHRLQRLLWHLPWSDNAANPYSAKTEMLWSLLSTHRDLPKRHHRPPRLPLLLPPPPLHLVPPRVRLHPWEGLVASPSARYQVHRKPSVAALPSKRPPNPDLGRSCPTRSFHSILPSRATGLGRQGKIATMRARTTAWILIVDSLLTLPKLLPVARVEASLLCRLQSETASTVTVTD